MNEIEIKIYNFIKSRCRGQYQAQTYKHIAFFLGINERELRDIVSRLVTDYQVPIATSQEGYWFIDNEEEFRLAHAELISRIKALAKRAKGLRKGFIRSRQEYKPRQLELV